MPDRKWESVVGSDSIRELGGGFSLVLECYTKSAYEMRGVLLSDVLQRLNSVPSTEEEMERPSHDSERLSCGVSP